MVLVYSEREQTAVIRAFMKVPPSEVVVRARRFNQSLLDKSDVKLGAAARYLVDTVNGRLYDKEDYGVSTTELDVNVSHILDAYGFTMARFDAVKEEIHSKNRELFEVINEEGEVHLKSNGFWGSRLGWLSPDQIKLHLLKRIINGLTPQIPHIIGIPKELDNPNIAPHQPATELTRRVFKRMNKALRFEQEKGMLPKKRDSNMANLMKAMEQAFIFVSEEDNYYRTWLAYLYTAIWEETQRLFNEFSYEMFINDMNANAVKVERDGLPIEFKDMFRDPLLKKQLFSWFLSKHLPHIEAVTSN